MIYKCSICIWHISCFMISWVLTIWLFLYERKICLFFFILIWVLICTYQILNLICQKNMLLWAVEKLITYSENCKMPENDARTCNEKFNYFSHFSIFFCQSEKPAFLSENIWFEFFNQNNQLWNEKLKSKEYTNIWLWFPLKTFPKLPLLL